MNIHVLFANVCTRTFFCPFFWRMSLSQNREKVSNFETRLLCGIHHNLRFTFGKILKPREQYGFLMYPKTWPKYLVFVFVRTGMRVLSLSSKVMRVYGIKLWLFNCHVALLASLHEPHIITRNYNGKFYMDLFPFSIRAHAQRTVALRVFRCCTPCNMLGPKHG